MLGYRLCAGFEDHKKVQLLPSFIIGSSYKNIIFDKVIIIAEAGNNIIITCDAFTLVTDDKVKRQACIRHFKQKNWAIHHETFLS